MKKKMWLFTIILVLAIGVPHTGFTAEINYKGKSLVFIHGYDAGSPPDVGARLMAESLAKYLPGQPAILVDPMPGTRQLNAMNRLLNARKDGFLFYMGGDSAILGPQLYPKTHKYDLLKIEFVGSIHMGFRPQILFTHKREGLDTLEKLMKAKEVPVAVTRIGSAIYFSIRFAAEVLGINFKYVIGYGDPERLLAVDRGEVAGTSCAIEEFTSRHPEWLEKDQVHLHVAAVSSAEESEPWIEKTLGRRVPSIERYFEEKHVPESMRDGFYLWADRVKLQRSIWLPPGTPENVVAVFEKAFQKMSEDSDFRSAFSKAQLAGAPIGKVYVGDEYRKEARDFIKKANPEAISIYKWLRQSPPDAPRPF